MSFYWRKTLTTVGLCAVVALAAAACSDAGASPSASGSPVACSSVSNDLKSVQATLKADQKKLDKSKGTPDETPDKNKVKADNAAIKSLKGQQSKCNSPSVSATPTASPAACPSSSWVMTTKTPSNGSWVKDGVPSIQKATTPAEAKAAAGDWLDKVKDVPGTLAGASAYLLNKQVDASTLVKKGCATPAAVGLVQELQAALALSLVTPANAPSNSVNSLTSNGQVLAESVAGVTGNTKAVKIVTKTTTIYVMARCGNAVKPGPPPVPVKPTPKPSPSVCTLVAPPGFQVTPQCTLTKPPQSKNCMLNGSWTKGCPPNQADQPVQSNPGQPTGRTSGAPTQAPPYNPPTPNPTTGPAPTPEPTGPGYNSGGGDGSAPGSTTCEQGGTCTTTSANPSPQPTDTDNGGDHNTGSPVPNPFG